MNLHTLSPAEKNKPARRVGRGIGSGLGKTSGKGHKGQWSRAGGGVRPGFEGGQMPLYRRLPKRGFNNRFKKNYIVVNLVQLNQLENGTVVDLQLLLDYGLVNYFPQNDGLKVLGTGEFDKKLTVKTNKISASAKEAIEKLVGTVELI